jgi:Fe2+ or Zn2+ uptake regulation protein
MDAPETAFADALRARGGRVTPQRLAIAKVVRETGGHVTAEAVYGRVSRLMPGVSLPTVYATLELLEELGQVRRVPGAAGAVIFDARTDAHDHFVCRRCGAAIDLDCGTEHGAALRAATSRGLHADDAQVVVSGVCADCAARN